MGNWSDARASRMAPSVIGGRGAALFVMPAMVELVHGG
jgi:hypothetical protein